jgi:hypothetical protein
MAFHVYVFLLVVCLLLASFAALASCLVPSWPSSSPGGAKRGTLHRLLKPRCPACRLASTASSDGEPAPADVASVARGEKPAGSSQAQRHPGLRLSQPKLPLLWHHRCTPTCAGGRWQAWPDRSHPNLSRSCLLYHVHFQAPHPLVPAENPFPPDRRRVGCAGRRAGSFRSPTGRRAIGRPPSRRGSLAQANMLGSSMSAASAPSGSRTSSWTNGAPGCAALSRCSGWPLILARALLPVLELGPRTQHMAHLLIHSLRQILAAFLPPALSE